MFLWWSQTCAESQQSDAFNLQAFTGEIVFKVTPCCLSGRCSLTYTYTLTHTHSHAHTNTCRRWTSGSQSCLDVSERSRGNWQETSSDKQESVWRQLQTEQISMWRTLQIFIHTVIEWLMFISVMKKRWGASWWRQNF